MANNLKLSQKITQAGVDLAVMRNGQSIALNITHVSVGSSKFNPTGRETSIPNEILKVPIESATKLNHKSFQIRSRFQAPTGRNFQVFSIGFWDNNTLVAVYSSNTLSSTGIFNVHDKIETVVSYVMNLEALPAENITVVIDQELDRVSRLLEERDKKIVPKKITATTGNQVDSTGHTHEIDLASLTTKGLVQLTNDTGLDSEALALTAKGGKALAQQIAQTQQRLTDGLNQKPNKSDISSAVNSESTTQLANSKAVKIAYDKAVEAKTAADGAYQVDRANQNRNLNILLGQNTVWGTANRGGSLTGLGSIYNYGVGLAMSAGGANAMLYIAHSHAGINNGVWVQASFSGNNSTPIWRRIDGTEWDEIRNNPLNVLRNLGTTDLNTVTGIGFYGQETYTNATTARNYPELIAGSLLVTPFGDGLIQEYSATNGRKYSRKRGSDRVWSDWVRIDGVGKLNGAGDTMTGTLEIKNGDWSKLMLTNSANKPLIFESQPDNTETFGSFFYRSANGEKEAEVKLPKAKGTLSLREDFTYQKTGNFEIRKYPDGTMIQTFSYEENDLAVWTEKAFNWAIAFVERPMMFAQITTSYGGAHDCGVNILTKSTNGRVFYHYYEHGNLNQGLCLVQFLAIGRWK